MKRRKALRQIGLGVSAGLVLPGLLVSCDKDDPKPEIEYDGIVGIVGAGAAGMYAADILRSKGIKIKVFEASDRVGGRVRTLRKFEQPTNALLFDPNNFPNSDFPTELGAERVIGTNGAWGNVISQLSVPAVDFTSVSTDNYFIDGSFVSSAEAMTNPDFVAAKSFYDNISANTSNGSVQQAIQSHGINSSMYAILNSWIGNNNGTSNDQLGMKALSEGLSMLDRNHDEAILKSNPMEDVLESQFNNVMPFTELNTIVKSVTYVGDKVVIAGEKKVSAGTFEAFSIEVDKLIVAVPVSILKSGLISFEPNLPAAKTTALSRMEMEASLRVVLEFRKNFWGTDSGFLYGGTQGPEYFNAGIGRSEYFKTLNVTVSGPKAEALAALGKDMVPVLLEELDSVFEGQASANVRKDENDNIISVIMDWSKEEYIKGGNAYVKSTGTNQDRINLAAPVEEKLFFAGEATDVNGEFGTINGALLSAERSAQEVIESILTV